MNEQSNHPSTEYWTERWRGEAGLARLLLDAAMLGAASGVHAPAGVIFDYCAASDDASVAGGARLARAMVAYAFGRDREALGCAEATLETPEQATLYGADARALGAAAAARAGMNARARELAGASEEADPAVRALIEAAARA